MEITVLVDNNTLIDRYFRGEAGLSIHIRDSEKNILFDCGYSDLFIRNALMMGIDLRGLDYVAISHGHTDHTGGLSPLLGFILTSRLEGQEVRDHALVCHPAALYQRTLENIGNVGSHVGRDRIASEFSLKESEKPFWITDDLVFLGEVPTVFDFEERRRKAHLHTPEGIVVDTIPDDSALACRTERGLVIIAGCSHAGICSTVEYAKEVCGVDKVTDIIGGMHLYSADDERIGNVAGYMKELAPEHLHPCHCTGKRAVNLLSGIAPGKEVGVGLRLDY